MFEILNIGISKCFYWNLDQSCKIWLKNSNPFWRYKQNVDCISPKWNSVLVEWNGMHTRSGATKHEILTKFLTRVFKILENFQRELRNEVFFSKFQV